MTTLIPITTASQQSDSPLLTLTEASGRLRISRTTLYHLIRSGHLTTIKLGRRRLVHRVDIDTLLDRLRASGAAE